MWQSANSPLRNLPTTGSMLDRRAVAHSGWGSQACSLSVDVVQRQRHAAPTTFLFRELRWAPAAMKLEDGPRAGGARGRGGDRPTGSMLDRRAVAHSGWGSQACSLSVDVVRSEERRAG